jgi:hypothetical protein
MVVLGAVIVERTLAAPKPQMESCGDSMETPGDPVGSTAIPG